MFEFLIPLAGSLLGAGEQSSAAKQAAATQAAASDRATQLQREIFEKQVGLQEPFRQAGMAGQNRLLELLGLRVPAQAGVAGPAGAAPAIRSEADLRNQLLSKYSTQGDGIQHYGPEEYMYAQRGPVVDEAGLTAAIRAAQQGDQTALTAYQAQQAQQAQQATPSADFGKYARDFSMADFQADPGYAFRLAEGQKALERTAAARGGLLSGGALKAAQRYGQEAGSQEYMNAFNRYQTSRTNQLNPLLSLSEKGQLSANTLGSAAGQYGTNVGNLMMGTGETQANALLSGARARGSAYQGIGELYGRTQPNFGSLFNTKIPGTQMSQQDYAIASGGY